MSDQEARAPRGRFGTVVIVVLVALAILGAWLGGRALWSWFLALHGVQG